MTFSSVVSTFYDQKWVTQDKAVIIIDIQKFGQKYIKLGNIYFSFQAIGCLYSYAE